MFQVVAFVTDRINRLLKQGELMVLLFPKTAFHLKLSPVLSLFKDQDLGCQKRRREQHIVEQHNTEKYGFCTVESHTCQGAENPSGK